MLIWNIVLYIRHNCTSFYNALLLFTFNEWIIWLKKLSILYFILIIFCIQAGTVGEDSDPDDLKLMLISSGGRMSGRRKELPFHFFRTCLVMVNSIQLLMMLTPLMMVQAWRYYNISLVRMRLRTILNSKLFIAGNIPESLRNSGSFYI